MAISKLLIVIGLLTCIMLSVMAHTEITATIKGNKWDIIGSIVNIIGGAMNT